MAHWLAIGAAAFALGAVVEERIGAAFDLAVAWIIAVPILVALAGWDAAARGAP